MLPGNAQEERLAEPNKFVKRLKVSELTTMLKRDGLLVKGNKAEKQVYSTRYGTLPIPIPPPALLPPPLPLPSFSPRSHSTPTLPLVPPQK